MLMGSVNSCQCTGKRLDGQAVTTANWKVLSDTVREKGDFWLNVPNRMLAEECPVPVETSGDLWVQWGKAQGTDEQPSREKDLELLLK